MNTNETIENDDILLLDDNQMGNQHGGYVWFIYGFLYMAAWVEYDERKK